MICPNCREGTRQPRGNQPERCIDKACPVDRIQRNNRGDAWAWDHTGRLVYKPNRHPLPVDTDPGKAVVKTPDPNRYVGHDPNEIPSDGDWFQATPHGTTGFGRRVKEPRK